ncbi:LacI family DNA-binding transcriptional regulator [Halomonas sp. LBP4]|uniref:LacI family DNA-binding transcriptional regulator n=1 Tax=Halomonas sp. LBP4 TaxID=2044917 RepID=UPI000D775632|nr:LacI family DNA-binding transcriptional regulator [Halomonas sp. LBP4]PXX94862.1 LacI family transcriptional regulator [Halomonas sp. LBP4]
MSKKSKDKEATNGTYKVTASDVARRAGVSKWTVSRAFTEGASISPKARERVLEAAEALGYRPNLLARGLTKRQTRIVGLVVDEMDNPNMLLLLNEASLQLQRRGFLSMLLNITGDGRQSATISLADQFQVDGLIFLGTVLTDELINLARDIRHIPLVVLYRNCEDPDIQVVSTDGYAAGREIAELLVAQDYRRIGYMAGPASESTRLRRLAGFQEGLVPHGVNAIEVLEAGHYRRDRGFATLAAYLDATPPGERIEALFCENDILAIGALDALSERGLDDRLAIVGFDDIEIAASPHYALTTYRQPRQALVAEAVRRVVDRPEADNHHLQRGELILRRSHLIGTKTTA